MGVNLVGSGAAPITIIIANLVINLRYLVMSASLSRRLRLNCWQAAAIGFGVTDEVAGGELWAQGEQDRDVLPSSFVLGVNLVSYLGWIAGTGAGVVFAGVLPARLTAGMGIVLYAMFIALLVPSVVKSLAIGVVAVASGAVCWLLSQILPFGWAMVLATTLIAALGVWLWGEGVDEL